MQFYLWKGFQKLSFWTLGMNLPQSFSNLPLMQHQMKAAAKINNVGNLMLLTCEILGAQYTIIIMIFMEKT